MFDAGNLRQQLLQRCCDLAFYLARVKAGSSDADSDHRHHNLWLLFPGGELQGNEARTYTQQEQEDGNATRHGAGDQAIYPGRCCHMMPVPCLGSGYLSGS